MLHAKNITKYYQDQKVIEGITLHVAPGELVCLLGKSGVGKTTLFQILSGLEIPDEGQVILKEDEITGIAGKMSYMQQKDLLLPFETIVDNAAAPLALRGLPRREARRLAGTHFEEFGLSGCQAKYPAQLSGGMRQRAALLRAWLFSGEMMLLDEPFSALDAATRFAMQQWFLKVIRTHNTTALLITHDVEEALLLADRIYLMAGVPGKILEEIPLLGQNRGNPEFSASPGFFSLKKRLLSLLFGDGDPLRSLII